MNEDVINDLKQFIAATVSQATAHLATKADLDEVKVDLAGVKADLESVKMTVEETSLRLDTIAEALNERLDNHEQRLVRLEARPA